MGIDFESSYYGLLHALKTIAPELKRISDIVVDSEKIDQFISLIDHEVAKTKGGKHG